MRIENLEHVGDEYKTTEKGNLLLSSCDLLNQFFLFQIPAVYIQRRLIIEG